MAWTVSLPGQPPSVNALYRATIRTDRSGRSYPGIIKSDRARAYHDAAIWLIRAARPGRWKPEGMIRIQLSLYLANDIDSDNTIKTISDAVQTALGIDDKRFLWCVHSKEVGLPRSQARVELVFCDGPEHC